ncbi:MAG: phosphodiesterase [Acidobacteria bacterium]|nr:MAG: phosphodiesterase [Acidobacteriota bacterium]
MNYRKVIVIGFDGLEPTIVERLLKAGALPSLAGVMRRGGYSRLRTTMPAQTPVAWSTFATGVNPGGHGIFDFVGRNPETYAPFVALNSFERKNAFLPPKAVNSRRGTPVWEVLTKAGIPSVVLRCPCTFPPADVKGRILAGVGVPDLRGGFGTSTFFTQSRDVQERESERVVTFHTDNGHLDAPILGPRNLKDGSDLSIRISVWPDVSARTVRIVSGGTPKELTVREGEWSDWLKLKFKAGLLQSVHGMVRFYLARLDPDVRLYASPVNFDPAAPVFPVSSPWEYAGELESRIGTYYTTGMVEDHAGLSNGRIDEAAYLRQCTEVMAERERMVTSELQRFDQGFLFCLFDTPDRLQHMFWRFREPDHPANRAGCEAGLKNVIEDHYQACDRIVGRLSESVDDRTLLIILSDHGMNSFQRGLHLNSWLLQNGFLALAGGVKPGEVEEGFQGVDWHRTKAYALGLGGIFLNLKGREASGIVDTGDAGALKTEIASRLTQVVDPDRGERPVRSVCDRDQIYSGPYVSQAPDLVVNFAPGYRVSWETPLGGVPEGLFSDNLKKWSGDHVIDPCLSPGVLMMNHPWGRDQAHLADLAPTILHALGTPRAAEMEGESLLS